MLRLVAVSAFGRRYNTSTAGTHTIVYTVTDQNGLTSTTTRTVIVQAPANSSDTSDVASTTAATTTQQ